MDNGGTIWFELGNNNHYWKDKRVQDFIHKFKLARVRIDGCQYGMSGKTALIKKPWRVMTNNPELIVEFENATCTGGHAHELCEHSAVTAKTSACPKALAVAIHVAYARHIQRRDPRFNTGEPSKEEWDVAAAILAKAKLLRDGAK